MKHLLLMFCLAALLSAEKKVNETGKFPNLAPTSPMGTIPAHNVIFV